MPRRQLITILHQLAEPAYRDFAARLIPGETRLLGVRLPALRKLARQYAAGDWRQLLATPAAADASFEELLLRAMLPAYAADATLSERLRYLQQEQPNLNNWSLCDSACATCRFVRDHLDAVFPWLEASFLHSEKEFTARFGIVMLNHYYAADARWTPHVIQALREVPQDAYYAAMAVAWCACTLLTARIDLRDDVGMELLAPGYLPEHTHKLLLRKLRESQKKWSNNKIY